jgi:hypothetical protein
MQQKQRECFRWNWITMSNDWSNANCHVWTSKRHVRLSSQLYCNYPSALKKPEDYEELFFTVTSPRIYSPLTIHWDRGGGGSCLYPFFARLSARLYPELPNGFQLNLVLVVQFWCVLLQHEPMSRDDQIDLSHKRLLVEFSSGVQ